MSLLGCGSSHYVGRLGYQGRQVRRLLVSRCHACVLMPSPTEREQQPEQELAEMPEMPRVWPWNVGVQGRGKIYC
jgi:hypothetical protein